MLLFFDGNLVTDAFWVKHFPAFLSPALSRSGLESLTWSTEHRLGDDQAGQEGRKLVLVSVMEPLDKKRHNAATLGPDMVSILHSDHFTPDSLHQHHLQSLSRTEFPAQDP